MVVVFSGCGDDHRSLGKVSGNVTLDGTPVARGLVYFIPPNGPTASGVIRDGKYELSTYAAGDGAVLGSHTVYFAPDPDESYMASYTDADYAAGKPPPEPPTEDFLPAKYLAPSSSGVSKEVTAGSNTCDLQLVSTGS